MTDNNGLVLVRFPNNGLTSLDVGAEHEDYSGKKMLWDLQSGDTLPASYTLKLGAEVKIGGVVVDDGENPILGAEVSLYRFWTALTALRTKKVNNHLSPRRSRQPMTKVAG